MGAAGTARGYYSLGIHPLGMKPSSNSIAFALSKWLGTMNKRDDAMDDTATSAISKRSVGAAYA